jgi:hypothetical protein
MIVWVENKTAPLTLTAELSVIRDRHDDEYPLYATEAPAEKNMNLIAEWVKETGCGRRTSYNTFKFRSRADMSMFLLRWNNTNNSN